MKKNEKRICWSCDGDVSLHLADCPYCGANLQSTNGGPPKLARKELGDPFQKAPEGVATCITEEDWEDALDTTEEEKSPQVKTQRELIALLLLLPGIVFCLFGLLLLFFSKEGTLTLHWNKHIAYFYFLGAIPMIFLGWRLTSKN